MEEVGEEEEIEEFDSAPFEDVEDPLLEKQRSVGVELVGNEEFDFLDGVSELATLTSELYDVREQLALSKSNGRYVPLKLYRSHCHNSLSVTDIQSGLWCESQLEYRYLYPHMKRTKQWEKQTKEGNEVQKKTPVMIKGASIHQSKELEIHEHIQVRTRTKEDVWTVKLLNTYNQLSIIKAGKMERELVVFGDPFGVGILLSGIIDQVEYRTESMELVVMDLKTRRTPTMPGEAQKIGHKFQVMMYKLLLDGLTRGSAEVKLLAEHLNLNLSSPLSAGVMDYIIDLGFTSLFSSTNDHALKFGEAIDILSALIKGLDLPLVTSLEIQYEYQRTDELIGTENVTFDRDWTRETLKGGIKFWRGEKLPSGPDIEDLWKCDSCQFKRVCVWTKQKALEKSPASKQYRTTTP